MSRRDFEQNSCRICRKVFCCENCRLKHEINTHKIHPECDICISGRIVIRDPSDSLLEHIEKNHWPLHCLFCGRVFNVIEDIFVHKKCIRKQEDNENNNTPPLPQKDNIKIAAGQSCVPTSTPLAPREDENKFLQQITEAITPVEMYVDKKDEVQYKSPFTPHNERKNEQYTKRRVTFSATIEEIGDNENMPPEKTNEPSTPTSLYSSSSSYLTAEMKTPSLFSIEETDEKAQNEFNESAAQQQSKRGSTTPEGETLWESAINDGYASQNVSIMEIGGTTEENNCVTYWPTDEDANEHSSPSEGSSIWSSVTSMIKSVVQGFSITQQTANSSCASLKRRLTSTDSEEDEPRESPVLKRMKLTEIKCRRPIRYMQPALYVRYGRLRRVACAHKVTQTDD